MKSYLAPISAFILFSVLAVPAAFSAPSQVPLTVTVQGDGTVMSEPAGITCPSVCDESYKKGTTVTLTATANPNSSFLGWNGACIGTDPICVTKVTAPTVVTAMFDTAAVVYPVPVPKTGQTSCWDATGDTIPCLNTGQDGEYQAGVELPLPRFVGNGNGTITDMLTGLVWLQDTLCPIGGPWDVARDRTNNLADGQCGLTDGSIPGDWRIPNVLEMMSLIDFETGRFPADNPFVGLPPQTGFTTFWTSTTAAFNTSLAYIMFFQLDGQPQGNSVLETTAKALVSSSVLPIRAQ